VSDKQIKIPRGGEADLSINRGKNRAEEAPATEPRRGGAFDEGEDDDVLAFKRGITFYDMGTRKMGDGSFTDSIPRNLVTPLTHTDIWNSYHNALLDGFDPGKCLRLPQQAEYLYADASFVPTDVDSAVQRNLLGRTERRPYVFELVTGGLVAQTRWSGGKLPYGGSNPYLSLETGFYYNAFVTQDDSFPPYDGWDNPFYMVTEEPDDSADSVPFALAGKDRVYLTPVQTLLSTGTTPNHLYYARRLPVLPDFDPQADPMTVLGESFDFSLFENVTLLRAPAVLWDALHAYYLANFPASFRDNVVFRGGLVEPFHPSYTVDAFVAEYDSPLRSWLAAVVVRGSQRFYVWRNYTAGFSGFRFAGYPAVFRRRSNVSAP
jgi:hypothetical protein